MRVNLTVNGRPGGADAVGGPAAHAGQRVAHGGRDTGPGGGGDGGGSGPRRGRGDEALSGELGRRPGDEKIPAAAHRARRDNRGLQKDVV
ncbi:hypothetical protein [Streptomyces sp. NPDC002104]